MPEKRNPDNRARVRNRIKELELIAKQSIGTVRSFVGRRLPAGTIHLNDDRLTQLVEFHYGQVGDFKMINGFPDGENIDYPKVASFTALGILQHLPIETTLSDEEWPDGLATLNPVFARSAFYSLLFVDEEAVDPEIDRSLLRIFLATEERTRSHHPDANLWRLFYSYLYPLAALIHKNFVDASGRKRLREHEVAWQKAKD